MTVRRAYLLPALCAAAIARVWILYAGRAGNAFEAVRFFGLPAAAVVWTILETGRLPEGTEADAGLFPFAAGALALYGASLFVLPNLAQAAIGLAALGVSLAAVYPAPQSRTRLTFAVLLPLALPLEPTVNFVLGYPLRRLTGFGACAILFPFKAGLEGTVLTSKAGALNVDIPCSGVEGLTVFLFAGCLAALAAGESPSRALLTLAEAAVCALFYNSVRAACLFAAGRFAPGSNAELYAGIFAFLCGLGLFVLIRYLSARLEKRREAAS